MKHTSLYEPYQTTERPSQLLSWATARAQRTYVFQPARTTPPLFGTTTREVFSGHFFSRQRHFVSLSTRAIGVYSLDSKMAPYRFSSFSKRTLYSTRFLMRDYKIRRCKLRFLPGPHLLKLALCAALDLPTMGRVCSLAMLLAKLHNGTLVVELSQERSRILTRP